MRKLLSCFLTLGFMSVLGAVGSGVGIASGLNSLFGSQSSPGGYGYGGPSQVPFYQPTGQSAADQNWQNMLWGPQGMMGTQDQLQQAISPQLWAAFTNSVATAPQYQANMQAAGNQAGGQYGNLSNLAQMYSQIMGQQGQQAMGYGNQIMQTAFDPQKQLYDRLLQQTQQQSRGATDMRGIGMGAESAGIENQDVQNLMMNWQNQQLGRQTQGAQAYGALNQLGGNQLGQSLQYGAQAPQYTMQSATTPEQALLQSFQMPATAATNLASGTQSTQYAPYQQWMGDIMQYLGYGSSNSQGTFNAANQAAGQAYGAQNQGLTNIGGGMNAFAQNGGAGSWLNAVQQYGLGNVYNSQYGSGTTPSGQVDMYSDWGY